MTRLTADHLYLLRSMAPPTRSTLRLVPRGVANIVVEADELGLELDAGIRDLWLGKRCMLDETGDGSGERSDAYWFVLVQDLLEHGLIVQQPPPDEDDIGMVFYEITNMGLAYANGHVSEGRRTDA